MGVKKLLNIVYFETRTDYLSFLNLVLYETVPFIYSGKAVEQAQEVQSGLWLLNRALGILRTSVTNTALHSYIDTSIQNVLSINAVLRTLNVQVRQHSCEAAHKYRRCLKLALIIFWWKQALYDKNTSSAMKLFREGRQNWRNALGQSVRKGRNFKEF